MLKVALKKGISMLFAIVILSISFTHSCYAGGGYLTSYTEHMYGDVDGDGIITVADASYIQRYIAGFSLPFTLDEKAADVDEDGDVSVDDASEILLWLVNLPYDGKAYGICFNNQSLSSVSRIISFASPDKQLSYDFNNIAPWSNIRRCNVTFGDGGISSVIYEGDSRFRLDGSSGNVMVEIPAFYIRRERFGNYECWFISAKPCFGFTLHPWFRNDDGTTAQYRYYAAYKASITPYKGVYSASGYVPYDNSGRSADYFRNLIPDGAHRNNLMALNAIQYLFCIEYATINSQSVFNGSTHSPYGNFTSTNTDLIISDITDNIITVPTYVGVEGNSFNYYKAGMYVGIGASTTNYIRRKILSITADDSNTYIAVDGEPIALTEGMKCFGVTQLTGRTDSLTTASGYESDTDIHVASFRYRYIENPWGSIWELVDGLKYKENSYYFTNEFGKFGSDISEWDTLSFDAPAFSGADHSKDNWIGVMGFDPNNRQMLLPSTLKTSSNGSNEYYGDGYYSTTATSTATSCAFGGGWDHHQKAGLFCQRFLFGSTLNWLYGERLTC